MALKSNDQQFVAQVVTTASNKTKSKKKKALWDAGMANISHFFYFEIFSASRQSTNFITSKVAGSLTNHIFFQQGSLHVFLQFLWTYPLVLQYLVQYRQRLSLSLHPTISWRKYNVLCMYILKKSKVNLSCVNFAVTHKHTIKNLAWV